MLEFRIFAVHSNKALEFYDSNSNETESEVRQHTYHGGTNQRWRIVELDSNDSTPQFKIESVHNGQVLDLWFGEDKDGALIKLYDWHGGPNQRWRLIEAFPRDEQKDQFLIQAVHSKDGKVLDVWGGVGEETDGAEVRLYHRHGAANQRWSITLAKVPTRGE